MGSREDTREGVQPKRSGAAQLPSNLLGCCTASLCPAPAAGGSPGDVPAAPQGSQGKPPASHLTSGLVVLPEHGRALSLGCDSEPHHSAAVPSACRARSSAAHGVRAHRLGQPPQPPAPLSGEGLHAAEPTVSISAKITHGKPGGGSSASIPICRQVGGEGSPVSPCRALRCPLRPPAALGCSAFGLLLLEAAQGRGGGRCYFCSPHPLTVSKNRQWIPGKRFRCVTISRERTAPCSRLGCSPECEMPPRAAE